MLGPLRPWGMSLLQSHVAEMMEANLVMVPAQTRSQHPVESLFTKRNSPCQSSSHIPYPQKVLGKLLSNGWMNKLVYEWICVWITLFLWGNFPEMNKATVGGFHCSSESDPPTHTESHFSKYGFPCASSLCTFSTTIWIRKAFAFISWVWKWKPAWSVLSKNYTAGLTEFKSS